MKQPDTITINLFSTTGAFANNKDTAQHIREHVLLPALKEGKTVIIDFTNVNSATQSFIHALISESIRLYGANVFDKIIFKRCSEIVTRVINIVAEYMQRSEGQQSA